MQFTAVEQTPRISEIDLRKFIKTQSFEASELHILAVLPPFSTTAASRCINEMKIDPKSTKLSTRKLTQRSSKRLGKILD